MFGIYIHAFLYVACAFVHVGPLTSFLDADKDLSSTLKYSGRTSPIPETRHQPVDRGNRDRGGVKFTDHELKVLRLVNKQHLTWDSILPGFSGVQSGSRSPHNCSFRVICVILVSV